MYYSTTPHSPTSVGSRISDQEPDEEFLGDIVPLAGPFIRPCQGRPNMSAYDIKEVTARDEAEEISRCMRRQDCYSPLHQHLWGQAIMNVSLTWESWYIMSSR